MKQGCHGGLVDPTAPKARFPVWVVSQAANILDPIFVSGIVFHLHSLLVDAFTAAAVGMQRALASAIGLPSRSTSASWMLVFLMSADVSRNRMMPSSSFS